MKASEIRERYLEFFGERGHYRLESHSLIPGDDPTLLLINAGMAPLKPYFLGTEEPPAERVVSCQKCLRTVDIEEVGTTPFHLTFFEMLGNFSFGDYFKQEAIELAWEFLTEVLELDTGRLAVTVHREDDTAEELWREQPGFDLPVYRLGDAENFWAAGETGPCGYDTEIFYDQQGGDHPEEVEKFLRLSDTRYDEIWNLVFMEFNRDEQGELTPLPEKNVDTGMGLERVATVLQGVESVFDTDLFRPLIGRVEELGIPDDSERDVNPARLAADHARAAVMLLSDGVIPGNEGRGYVLRKIIRRAVKTAFKEDLREPFLLELAGLVRDKLAGTYPELSEERERVDQYLQREERQFLEVLEESYDDVLSLVERADENDEPVPGERLFFLHDTRGFPFDVAAEIAREHGVAVDREGFEREMKKQRERARESSKVATDFGDGKEVAAGESEFTGYESLSEEARVVAVEMGDEAGEVYVTTDLTPFYDTGGGQPGDTGRIRTGGIELEVLDTPERGVHRVQLPEGVAPEEALEEGDEVRLEVDRTRREAIRRSHSATHLLHKALKTVLGDHVTQQGSQLYEDSLRFDFNHFEALSDDEIADLERLVNRWVLDDLPVDWEYMDKDRALERGAVALFGENYGETVRVVEIGEVSMELCGGTHVGHTAQIGPCIITTEESVSSGTRRVEMVVGREAVQRALEREHLVKQISRRFKAEPEEVPARIAALEEEVEELEQEVEKLRAERLRARLDDIVEKAVNVNGVRVMVEQLSDVTREQLKQAADHLTAKLSSPLVVLGAEVDGSAAIAVKLGERPRELGYAAGDLARELAEQCGGGGGGRPEFATAGGSDAEALPEALDELQGRIISELTQEFSDEDPAEALDPGQ